MKLNLPSLLVAMFFACAWHLGAAVRYVNVNNAAPAAPFTSWATAATNLQAAVDQAVAGDDILVTNGVYRAGGARTEFGEVTNRVAINKALVVRSVNGPFVTFIEGRQTGSAIRGAYVANGAVLAGFTLTNGSARSTSSEPYSEDITGGGVLCESASAVVSNCVIVGNLAQDSGGGAQGGTFKGCAFYFNAAPNRGGGAQAAALFNCTLTANTAAIGGGTESCAVRNSILYYNHVTMRDANYSGGTVDASCTTPLPDLGSGNLMDDPQLADHCHLGATSPCRGAGSAAFASGRDLDSQPWLTPPSMGCDEYNASLAGPLSVAIQAANTNVAVGFGLELTCLITGSASVHRWDFGDSVIVSNRLAVTHAWAAPGNYPVVLRAYNSSNPGGISATVVVQVVAQPIYYAARNNPSPVAPYTSWATAATNLQDAVNAATTAGALVLVTNGVYDTGGRAALDASNRVAVLTPLLLQSVNGPEATIINGGAVARCVALVASATLNGFTLTNGSSSRGGGVYGTSSTALVTNCVLAGNAAYDGGGAYQGTLNRCTLIGNSGGNSGAGVYGGILNSCSLLGNRSSWVGGGAFLSTLNNCTLATNNAFFGGGADSSWLNNCSLVLNTAVGGGGVNSSTLSQCSLGTNSAAWYGGGGARQSLLTACTLTGNSADSGGGAENSQFFRCTLAGNSASDGGGANNSFLTNCFLYGNWSYNNGGGLNACLAYGSAGAGNAATNNGGGAYSSTLLNCTFTGNAATFGGGMHSCDVTNTILYFNFASGQDANFSGGTLNFCCTTPLPSGGSGNLTGEPKLADPAHLSAGSPCRGTGSAISTSGKDIDGETWTNPADIGCDEFVAGAITGALTAGFRADYTNVAAGYPVTFTALISGHATSNRWEFGDGTNLVNQLFPVHSWELAGDYSVVVRVFNETYPAGISATSVVHVIWQPTHYVSQAGTNPVPPYFDWAHAATNIQQAVDVAYAGGLVLVTNGIYQTGGRVADGAVSNRLVVTRPVSVASVNGPGTTIIRGVPTNGPNAMRCVYLGGLASLTGFTLTNGATGIDGDGVFDQSGGGLWCASTNVAVSSCVLVANSANNAGGGVYRGRLSSCTLSRNQADSGGGAQESLLFSCFLASNSATLGGGAYAATLNNCVLSNNLAGLNGGGAYNGMLSNCVIRGNSAPVAGGAFSATVIDSTLVTNVASSYAGGAWGGNFTNCVFTGNSAPAGGGASASTLSRCSLIANTTTGSGGGADGCLLERCTLGFNSAISFGGGANGSTLYNCIVSSNTAASAGGSYQSGLNNCVLARNTATGFGGGTRESDLVNCTVYGNTASVGGGVYDGTVTNSIVQSNVGLGSSNNYCGSIIRYSSTMPLPPGPGNFTNAPALGNPATGNYHLQFGSLGINAGYSPAAPPGNDCDHLPRLVGPVDLGAYEYQTPASQLSYYWLAKYSLPANGTADFIDSDGDALSNYLEWVMDSNPTNALSKFQLVTITNHPSGGLDVLWQSSSWRTYFLERGTNLADLPPFQPLATDIPGQAGTTTFTDAAATNAGPYFYRVGLQP